MDLKGKKFGKLTVVRRLKNNKHHLSMWLCKCECGNETVAYGVHLNKGYKKSCGCLLKIKTEDMKKKITTHGMTNTRIYNTWHNMKQRCLNPNKTKDYPDYGGRGIKVCDEWLKFENFYNWAMDNGYTDELTIDRIDVNGNYEPDNCRWATIKEQMRNQRKTILVNYHGKKYTLKELSEMSGIKAPTLFYTYKTKGEECLIKRIEKVI